MDSGAHVIRLWWWLRRLRGWRDPSNHHHSSSTMYCSRVEGDTRTTKSHDIARFRHQFQVRNGEWRGGSLPSCHDMVVCTIWARLSMSSLENDKGDLTTSWNNQCPRYWWKILRSAKHTNKKVQDRYPCLLVTNSSLLFLCWSRSVLVWTVCFSCSK